MKKLFLFIVLFLLSFSLVAAVQVSTNKVEYSGSEVVTATITGCAGTSLVEFRNPSGDVVDIKTGKDSWSTSYNTLSDSSDGKYKVDVTCTNGPAEAFFCVDAPGCIPVAETAAAAGGAPGGGIACTPNWNCGEWSYCGPELTETRSCTDLNNCRPARDETRLCEACQESWVCSLWAECSAGTQTRVCYDEHFCETEVNKPALQKECAEAEPFPIPAQVSYQLPPPFVPQAPAAAPSFLSKLLNVWDTYKLYILGALAAVVLGVVILLAIYFLKPKKVAYNINELKQWVRKEKVMGTSDEDIRVILKQQTGWTDEEMDMAFESQQQPQAAVVKKTPA